MQEMNKPKLKLKLSTGKTVFFREAMMADQRQASSYCSSGIGNFNVLAFIEEFVKNLIVKVTRANGEEIDCIDKKNLFDKVFNMQEVHEIMSAQEQIIGSDPKKKPQIEHLT